MTMESTDESAPSSFPGEGRAETQKKEMPDGMWVKCDDCGEIIHKKELEQSADGRQPPKHAEQTPPPRPANAHQQKRRIRPRNQRVNRNVIHHLEPVLRPPAMPARRGSVLASDAYFPFADGVERAIESGVTAMIQPGGSIRDREVIEAADKAGVAMIFTGIRHFKH